MKQVLGCFSGMIFLTLRVTITLLDINDPLVNDAIHFTVITFLIFSLWLISLIKDK